MEALAIIDCARGCMPAAGRSALDLLKAERAERRIVTGSQRLDGLLGGGMRPGVLTEVCGAPGCGKTQLAMQLACCVQIGAGLGGLGGEAVYVDTEGSFVPARCAEIAEALGPRLGATAQQMLERIHVFRAHSYVELIATVTLLREFVADQHPGVRLVVIDSVAFHFRRDFEDVGLRGRLLSGLAQELLRLAAEHGLAVLLVNQMTTKRRGAERAHLAPALGESWGHNCTTRVVLSFDGAGGRMATLYKSPTDAEAEVPYTVTAAGIRDLEGEHNAKRPKTDA